MRSFGLVDEKLAEADFFLARLEDASTDLFAAQCYLNAFAASARSVTFALQASLSDHPQFPAWYAVKQEELRSNDTARYFHRVRTESQHVGIAHVRSCSFETDEQGRPVRRFSFKEVWSGEPTDAPDGDVVDACRTYLTTLTRIVFECYDAFGFDIDPDQYYTAVNLARLNRTVEDFEEELGFPRGWTDTGESDVATRLRHLRDSMPGTEVDELFEKYLGTNRLVVLARRGLYRPE